MLGLSVMVLTAQYFKDDMAGVSFRPNYRSPDRESADLLHPAVSL